MNFDLVLQLASKYLEAHPEVLEQLIEQVFKAVLAHLQAANAPKP